MQVSGCLIDGYLGSQSDINTREYLSASVSCHSQHVHGVHPTGIFSPDNEIRYVARSGGRKTTDAHTLAPVDLSSWAPFTIMIRSSNTCVVICTTSRGLFGLPMVYGTTPVLPLIDLAWPIITSRCPGYYGICTSPLSPAICLVSGVLECPSIGDQRPIHDVPSLRYLY